MSEERTPANILFRQLNFIFYFLLTVQLVIVGISFLVVLSGKFQFLEELHSFFRYFSPIYSLGLTVVAYFLYARFIKAGMKKETLPSKFVHFKVASILKMSMIGGLNIFNAVVFLLTGMYYYLLIFLAMMALFFLSKASLKRFITDAKLSVDEQARLSEP